MKFNVPPEFIKGIIMTESAGSTKPSSTKVNGKICDESEKCVCNSAGYCGLMQTGHYDAKCNPSYECSWENFQKGDEGARDQVFSGTNWISELINRYCKLAPKERGDYFYWIALCYNAGATSAANVREFAAQRLGIPKDNVQWKDVTIEDAKMNQQKIWPNTPGKTEETFYYPSKVMSVVQATAEGSRQTVTPALTQQCSYGYTYDYISIGKYFVNPSFTAEVDYNLNDYKAISDAIKSIISRCQGRNSENLRECVKDAAEDSREIANGEILLYNGPCDYGENMFSDFAEWTDACLKSSEDNCHCRIPLEYEYEKKNTDEEISISASGLGTVQISSTNPGIAPQQIAGASVSGSKTITTKSSAETHYANKLGNTLTYADSGTGNRCKVNKRIYKFCAETKKKYMVYDEKEKMIVSKPMQYKFAVEFLEQGAAAG